MNKQTCWVTGAAGLIGSALVASPHRPAGWNVLGLDRSTLELADFDAVRRRFDRDRPSCVIHCAAMSRSPQCEADPDRARLWNVEVTRLLADLFDAGRMVFLSTDLVFDGSAPWYREEDRINPLSTYARTKVEAEEAVLGHSRHLVVRTSLNHGHTATRDRAFNEELRNAWVAGRVPRLFTDEFRTPIGAVVTARALWELAAQGVTGILHVSGSERLSRWEIGRLVAESLPGMNCPLEQASLRDFRGAPRPPDVSLDCGRAQALLGFRLPAYSDWIRGGEGTV